MWVGLGTPDVGGGRNLTEWGQSEPNKVRFGSLLARLFCWQFRERRAIEMLTVRTCQCKRNIVDVFVTCDTPHCIFANSESQLCGI